MNYITINKSSSLKLSLLLGLIGGLNLTGCSINEPAASTFTEKTTSSSPGKEFDLSHWKLTLPTDIDSDGKVDGITTAELQNFVHSDFFYLDEQGHMVFTAPNRGATTANSKNTRSELRYMSRGADRSIKTQDPLNNFAVASHAIAGEFASIGSKMEATLHIDHAPRNSNNPNHSASYAAVIGQIHATKSPKGPGFGYGNEPLKIIYKKWPGHKTGSVYWNYERNLERNNPDRRDVSYQVWGNSKRDSSDPGETGIALGEDFSYSVNVYKDTMYLIFDSPRLGIVNHQINLANNIDANGRIDEKDNSIGYANDRHYFKAGVYNQCRAVPKNDGVQATCPGTGDWDIDQVNGDYAQVSFSKLIVTDAELRK